MSLYHHPTLAEKIELTTGHANGDGFSQRRLSAKYKVSKGTMYSILQGKDEYKFDFEVNANKGIQRKLKDESGQKIDEAAFSWFAAQRAKSVFIVKMQRPL